MQSLTKMLSHYDDYKCVYAGQFIHMRQVLFYVILIYQTKKTFAM